MTNLLSSGLLAASMLLGQPGTPPASADKVVPAPKTQAAQPTTRPILGWFQRDDRPVINKIQGWFKRDQPEAQPTSKSAAPRPGTIQTDPPPMLKPAPVPIPPANDFPKRLPNPTSQGIKKTDPVAKATTTPPQEIQQVSAPAAAVPAKTQSPILPQLAGKMGRDEKFEWITGQLEVENGNFVMYYASPETVDKYNGRIVLSPQQVDLGQFKRGDLVSVRGQLVQRPTVQGMVPLYRINHASLIERPKS